MRYSFCGHFLSGICTICALIFSSGALFSCFWTSFYVRENGALHGSGLFGQGSDGVCRNVFRNNHPGWLNATLAFMIIGFVLQIIHVIILFVSWYSSLFLKIDLGLLIAIFISLLIAVSVYAGQSGGYFGNMYLYETKLDWSFAFAVVSLVISFLGFFPIGWAYVYISDKGDVEFNACNVQSESGRRQRRSRRPPY